MASAIPEWISTFEGLSGSCSSLGDLADGVLLFEVCSQIDAELFDVSSIKADAGSNWMLRKQNLQRLLKGLARFYQERVKDEVDAGTVDDLLSGIDATSIAKDGDATDLMQLTELVLGCAVLCEDKQVYISNIMNMGDEGQGELMVLIQRTMGQLSAGGGGGGGDDEDGDGGGDGGGGGGGGGAAGEGGGSGGAAGGGSGGLIEEEDDDDDDDGDDDGVGGGGGGGGGAGSPPRMRGEQERQIEALRKQVAELREKKNNMTAEMDELVVEKSELARKLEAATKDEGEKSATKSRHAKLMESIEHAEEHSAELENKLRQKEAELDSIREQAEEQMNSLREQLAQMEDELDVSRSSAQQHAKTEAALMKARSRLEEMADLKKQMAELEKQNEEYMQRSLSLESELTVMPKLKKQ
eukprot:g5913.t1